MVALYIASVGADGKTALCAGIGSRLLAQGKKVGFIMPLQLSETSSVDAHKDAAFIKEALRLIESIELLCPIRLPRSELWRRLTDDVTEFSQRLKQAYRKISRGKDIVIMEGLRNLDVDKVSTLACYTIAEVLEAKVIIPLRYSADLEPSRILKIGEKLKQQLLGVVINFVPESRIEAVKRGMAMSLEAAGIKVLGILPEFRGLLGVTVGELVEALGGEILTFPESTGEIVENIMLGAMTPDSGIDYFNRKVDKATVIRGERADMQLAALQTSIKCLIVTNNVRPLPSVISEAEEKRVPLIMVKQDTSATVSGIEEALAKSSFRNSQKLQKLENLLDSYFDFRALYSELGLKA